MLIFLLWLILDLANKIFFVKNKRKIFVFWNYILTSLFLYIFFVVVDALVMVLCLLLAYATGNFYKHLFNVLLMKRLLKFNRHGTTVLNQPLHQALCSCSFCSCDMFNDNLSKIVCVCMHVCMRVYMCVCMEWGVRNVDIWWLFKYLEVNGMREAKGICYYASNSIEADTYLGDFLKF